MRRFLAVLLTMILLASLAGALAEAAEATDQLYDVTGDWTIDYFGIPMIFHFLEDGTFEGVIDMDIPVADDGSNSIFGLWAFDGQTLTIFSETPEDEDAFSFVWDGEKLSGVMECTELFMYPVTETEESAAEQSTDD